MRRTLQALSLAFLLVLLVSGAAYGAVAEKSVTVTIPAYGITVNGVKIDNSHIQYPFIVYNDITYFPMTYNDCRFLGLETEWQGNTTGLAVEKTGITAAYKPQKASAKNGGRYPASVPDFPVKVNGKTVDNSKEQYPLLSFRNVAYFPMTWEFGVKEFGWDYSFDSQNGLTIRSANLVLEQKPIANGNIKKAYDDIADNVAVTDQYAYYEDNKGRIIQAPLANLSKTKTVYQLPYGKEQPVYPVKLYADKDVVYLFYHQGGATMGTGFLIRFNDDGSTEKLLNYNRVKTFGNKIFFLNTHYGPPYPGNLFFAYDNGEPKPLGDPDYHYVGDSGGSETDDLYLVGDDLYILAYPMKQDYGRTGIYKVNIHTNEVTRISQREALSFQKESDFLYYPNEGSLYRISLTDGTEELVQQLSQNPSSVRNFAVLNGKVYWQDDANNILYNAASENVNPGAELDDLKLAGDDDEYLVCTFKETALSKYRIMIFDKSGKVVFKTSDKAYGSNIFIKANTVYFYNSTAGTICIGTLNETVT